jgi:hypothetical protein
MVLQEREPRLKGIRRKMRDLRTKKGTRIRITRMEGEPQYNGREGTVTRTDDRGQLHGTWGGLALIPETDEWEIIEK